MDARGGEYGFLDRVVDEFYDDMRRAISTVPRHNVLVVMGDFNARVGSTDGRFTFHKETNRNGEKLMELTQEIGQDLSFEPITKSL